MGNLTISAIGPAGSASLSQLEARCGPCQGLHHGRAVTLVARAAEGVAVRYFHLPTDLAQAFADGGRYIAPGLLVGIGKVARTHLKGEGPGASSWAATRGMPGRRNNLPELSAGWLAAIRAAVAGSRPA